MEIEAYREFLRRADAAVSVRELRAISDEARAAYPADSEAELIDATCFSYATALIDRAPDRRALVPTFVEPGAHRAPAGDASRARPASAPAVVLQFPAANRIPAC